MLLTEKSLLNAISLLLEKSFIPRPCNWTLEKDREWKMNFINAYFESLKKIEEVDPCFGFDIKKIDKILEGWGNEYKF